MSIFTRKYNDYLIAFIVSPLIVYLFYCWNINWSLQSDILKIATALAVFCWLSAASIDSQKALHFFRKFFFS